MTTAFKADFYDAEREQYRTKQVSEFVATLKTVRDASRADDNLASAMGNVRIG